MSRAKTCVRCSEPIDTSRCSGFPVKGTDDWCHFGDCEQELLLRDESIDMRQRLLASFEVCARISVMLPLGTFEGIVTDTRRDRFILTKTSGDEMLFNPDHVRRMTAVTD